MFGHPAKATGARALMFGYRLAAGHTHPTHVDDATAVYRCGCSARREGGDPRDPLANPLYADVSGLGPIYI